VIRYLPIDFKFALIFQNVQLGRTDLPDPVVNGSRKIQAVENPCEIVIKMDKYLRQIKQKRTQGRIFMGTYRGSRGGQAAKVLEKGSSGDKNFWTNRRK